MSSNNLSHSSVRKSRVKGGGFSLPVVYGIAIVIKVALYFSPQFGGFWAPLLYVNLLELLFWSVVVYRRFTGCRSHFAYLLFLGVNAVYVNVPLALLSFGFPIFPFDADVVAKAMAAQSLATTNLYLFIFAIIRRKHVEMVDAVIRSYVSQLRVTTLGGLLAAFFGFVLAAAYLQNYYYSGAHDLVSSGASRVTVAKAVETGKLWLMQYAFIAWFMAVTLAIGFAGRGRRSFFGLAIVCVSLVLFFVGYLGVGNRRELAIYILFVITVAVVLEKKGLLLVGFGALPVLLFVGVWRTLRGAAQEEFLLLDLVGEFVFPHFSLMYYSSATTQDFWYGLGYLRFPLYVLPDFGLWDKSQSFAMIFADEFSGGAMGFAFTPLAEGYLNFGWTSVIVVPLLIAISFRVLIRLSAHFPFAWIAGAAFALDICRGEFVAVLFQWLIFCLAAGLTLWILRVNATR